MAWLDLKASGLKRQTFFWSKIAPSVQIFFGSLRAFFIYIILLIMCVMLFTMTSLDSIKTWFVMTVQDITAPIVHAMHNPFEKSHQNQKIDEILTSTQGNQSMQDEILGLKMQNDVLQRQNKQLKELLLFQETKPLKEVTTSVLAMPDADTFHYALIRISNATMAKHVGKDSAIVSSKGLVGRLVDKGNKVARVMLITHPLSRTPVRCNRNSMQAIAAGKGNAYLEITHLQTVPLQGENLSEQSLKVGDVLVTSGYGGVYPADLPVGRIVKVEPLASGGVKVRIKPFVEVHTLEVAAMLVGDGEP